MNESDSFAEFYADGAATCGAVAMIMLALNVVFARVGLTLKQGCFWDASSALECAAGRDLFKAAFVDRSPVFASQTSKWSCSLGQIWESYMVRDLGYRAFAIFK